MDRAEAQDRHVIERVQLPDPHEDISMNTRRDEPVSKVRTDPYRYRGGSPRADVFAMGNLRFIKLLKWRPVGIVAVSAFFLLGQATIVSWAAAASNSTAQRIQVDLKRHSVARDDFPKVLFSEDGRTLCTWWGLGNGPVKFVVLDLGGKTLGGSDETNCMDLLRGFPTIAWRWKHGEFVRDAQRGGLQAFTFSPDLSLGLKIVVPKRWPNGSGPVTAELWKLSEPMSKVWSRPLSRPWEPPALASEIEGKQRISLPPIPSSGFAVQYAAPIGRLNDLASGPVFINADGNNCCELDTKTGEILKTFTFGPIESDTEAHLRAKRFGAAEDYELMLKFRAGNCAYEPARGWIACGATQDRRTRVIAVSQPEKILFEVNSDSNPIQPFGGSWRVAHVGFLAGGRYLVAASEYVRRFGPYEYITEIFETSSWRIAWKSDDAKLQSVALSPDGDTMAYTRGTTLVICPFGTNMHIPIAK
jgi:hypothetical protein